MLDVFLPQYAAQAVIDLERTAKLISRGEAKSTARGHHADIKLAGVCLFVAEMIRGAVKVVLPDNGEIYRPNVIDGYEGGLAPSDDESTSFVMPAKTTCFEYAWTHKMPDPEQGEYGERRFYANKRIVVAHQASHDIADRDIPEGMSRTVQLWSICFDNESRMFGMTTSTIALTLPLRAYHPGGYKERSAWSFNCAGGYDFLLDKPIEPRGEFRDTAIVDFRPDITAMVQFCHALRAGATLDAVTEKSSSRRKKFEKRGVGGFEYHVVKLPTGKSKSRSADSAGHASPRFHFRRAHIRKIDDSRFAFVRSCMVGDPSNGLIEKNYAGVR